MKKALQAFVLFLAISFSSKAQLLKRFDFHYSDSFEIAGFEIRSEYINILLWHGSAGPSPTHLKQTLFQMVNDSFVVHSQFSVHGSGGWHVLRHGNRHYIFGNFDSVDNVPGPRTNLLVHNGTSYSKVNFLPLFPGADGWSFGNLTSYSQYMKTCGDTAYAFIRVQSGQNNRRAVVRIYPGGMDTMINTSGKEKFYNFHNGIYAADTASQSVFYRLAGRNYIPSALPFPTYGYYKKGSSDDSILMHPDYVRDLSDSGDYVYEYQFPFVLKGNKWKPLNSHSWIIQQVHRVDEDYYSHNAGSNDYLYLYRAGKWIPVANLHGGADYGFTGVYRNDLYSMIEFHDTQGLPDRLYLYKLNKNFGSAKGYLFEDANSNCTKDGGEPGYKNAFVEFQPGYVFGTDSNGYYEAVIDTGSFNVRMKPKRYVQTTCTSSLQAIQIFPDSATELNIPVSKSPNVHDLGVYILPVRPNPRRGFDAEYQLHVRNQGTTTTSYYLDLNYDSRLSHFTSSDSFVVIDSNTIRFIKPSLAEHGAAIATFTMKPDTAGFHLGDSFFIDASVVCSTTDSNLSDNRDTLDQVVVGAYDPNEKAAFPGQNAKARLKEVMYQIHFQNLGSDSAVNITVQDTLDPRLKISSFDMLCSSHPYTVSIRQNVINWRFSNIMLPPAKTNEKASQGFVSFMISTDSSLPVQDSLRNRAHIYFDFEAAVITNYAVSKYTVPAPLSIPPFANQFSHGTLKIYPNPASDELYVLGEPGREYSYVLYDAMGRSLASYTDHGFGELRISLPEMSDGIYFIVNQYGQSARLLITKQGH